ncbi:MAG: hypothetical protein OHK0023_20350 [Anaerolineae bacterium]
MNRIKHLAWVIVIWAVSIAVVPSFVSAHEGGPHVRVAHLSPTSPAVDVYINGKLSVEELKYPDVTKYLGLEGYEFSVIVVPHGGIPSKDSVTEAPIMLKFAEGDGGYYTVAAVGSLSDKTFAVIMLPADGPADQAMGAMTEKGKAEAGNLSISEAFARPTAAEDMDHAGHGGMEATAEATKEAMGGMSHGAKGVSAAYMTITNKGDKADRLVKVEASVAGLVEIHETVIQNDIAQMQALPNGIEVPALGSVELKPGGYHIMLMDLKEDLVVGQTISIKLTFESGVTIELNVPVLMP